MKVLILYVLVAAGTGLAWWHGFYAGKISEVRRMRREFGNFADLMKEEPPAGRHSASRAEGKNNQTLHRR